MNFRKTHLISWNLDELLKIAIMVKVACHANVRAKKHLAGSYSYILRHIFQKQLSRSANNRVSL